MSDDGWTDDGWTDDGWTDDGWTVDSGRVDGGRVDEQKLKLINMSQDLQVRMLQFIEEKNLAHKGDRILLAVSGGMDSSVMVNVFSKTDFDFGIAHCNFSLRGKESDEEEEFVEEMTMKLNKPFYSIRFDTKKFAEENKISIQEAARILRYRRLKELCDKFNYQKTATAHHLDDSIETFFINLIRGTGHAGLRGIPVVNERIIRPLLFAVKSDIETYARKEKIRFRNDSSNASDEYLRNRIRHHLIPVMKENTQAFEHNMEKLMSEMSSIHSLMMDRMKKWRTKNMKEDSSKNMSIPLRKILEEPEPSSFLSTLFYSIGIKGVDTNKILKSEMPGKIFSCGNFEILRDRNNLVIKRKEEREKEAICVEALPARIDSKKMSIAIHSENDTGNGLQSANDIQHIDGDSLQFPLTIRHWKPGDYFIPLGMKGKKKLSDFFTDIKMNRFEKDNTFILLSGNDIVCILGHRIDDRFKIKPSTKKILTIEIAHS